MVTESWNPTVVCAWCSKTLSFGDPKMVSHGMCRHCSLRELDDDGLLSWWEKAELLVWEWWMEAVVTGAALYLGWHLHAWMERGFLVVGGL